VFQLSVRKEDRPMIAVSQALGQELLGEAEALED
jgi:hypothetical protein